MKSVFFALMAALSSVSAYGQMWNIRCDIGGLGVLAVTVDSVSVLYANEYEKDPVTKPAKALVRINYKNLEWSFRNTVYVIDEEQGNFRLEAFGFVKRNSSFFSRVVSLYYDEEEQKIYGEAIIPYELLPKSPGAARALSFDALTCKRL